jgi:hypothetical protein
VKSNVTGNGEAQGMTLPMSSAGMNESAGATRKRIRLVCGGKVSSLRRFLSPSASG